MRFLFSLFDSLLPEGSNPRAYSMLTDPKALFALFGQPSVEGLRYIHPLGRYVFLTAMVFFLFDVAQDRGWIGGGKQASWMETRNRH